MKATLEDILGGEAEIPDDADAIVKTIFEETIVLSGPDKSGQLWALVKGAGSLGQCFWDYWPGSCEWAVEWSESTAALELGE